MNVTASKHPPQPPVVALIWLINTIQLNGLVKTSHLGYFLARVHVINLHRHSWKNTHKSISGMFWDPRLSTVNQLYLAAIKFGVWAKVDLFGAF